MACNQPPKSSWAERQWRGAGRVLRVSHQPRLPNPGGIRQVVKVRNLCGVQFQLWLGRGDAVFLFKGLLGRWLSGHLVTPVMHSEQPWPVVASGVMA